MSSLLEQAIIDATDLKEVALKTAETQILEKYSPISYIFEPRSLCLP